MKDELRARLTRAEESLEEAKALLDAGAELNFVINSIYYAFLYPVLGLLHARKLNAPLQSAAIALFEREFVQTGDFDRRSMDGLRTAFELRPACACEGHKKATREEIERLLPVARDFLVRARQVAE